MKIIDIQFYYYNAPFHSPIITPKVEMTHRKALIVRFISDEGKSYFGECNAFETDWYDTETIETVKMRIQQWSKNIFNQSFHTFNDWLPYLDLLDNYPATRCTIVMAVYQMFHSQPCFNVEYGATISGLSSSQLQTLKDTKPARIKLKWGSHLNNDIRKLKNELTFEFDLALDANESLDRSQFQLLENIDQHDILYVEEPFKNLEYLSHMDVTHYPAIAIDEKATDLQTIMQIIQQYPITAVVIKPFRLGGIDRSLELIHLLKEKNIKVIVGGMYEYGLSRYFTALLAKEGSYPGDVTPDGYYFEKDFTQGVGKLKEGLIYFNPPKVNINALSIYE
mgnify:CR=1 FL=1